jgi:hypothetical protein
LKKFKERLEKCDGKKIINGYENLQGDELFVLNNSIPKNIKQKENDKKFDN